MYNEHNLIPQIVRITLYALLVFILYRIGFADYSSKEDILLISTILIPPCLMVLASMRKNCKISRLLSTSTWLVISDLYVTTMLAILGEEQMAFITLLYFFIIFTYGLQAGYSKTFFIYLLSLACFIATVVINPYFASQTYISLTIGFMLTALPIFYIIALKESDERHQAQATFLARMSHELRNPLNGMLGATELLSDTTLSPKQSKYINQISSLSRILLDQIKNILDFQKIETVGIESKIENVDFHSLLQETVESYRSQAEEKDLHYTLNYANNLPEYIKTDPALLISILSNLITNSINYTSRGSIEVAVKLVGDKIITQVADTGQGIPDSQHESIMKPFVQGDTIVSKYQGTGLGTSIIHNSVMLLGGQVDFNSTVNQGTTFTVTLPYTPGRAPLEKQQAQIHNKQLTVLLAEDDIVNLKIIRSQIEALGHHVITAIDGEEALKKVKLNQDKIDVILLDLSMPKLTGEEVLKTLPITLDKPPKTIVLTANATPEIREKCLRLGASGFLAKPIDRETLSEHLGRYNREEVHKDKAVYGDELLDMQEFDLNYSNRPDFAQELVQDFNSSISQRLQEMTSAIDTNNKEQFVLSAHSIKGISATIGAKKLYESIKDIHESSKTASDLGTYTTQLPSLEDLFLNSYHALKKHVASYP